MASFALPSVTAVPAPCSWKWKAAVRGKPLIFPSTDCYSSSSISIGRFDVRAFFPNPSQQPILKEALKEPVAFVGGIFAGLLRLDLNEEPLREWVARTVEASGIASAEDEEQVREEEEQVPQQIEIE